MPKKKRTYQDRKKSKFFAKQIADTLAGKRHPNKGKRWGKPFNPGTDARRDKANAKRKKLSAAGKLKGRPTNEVKAYLLDEFLLEQPLVKARMRLPQARTADHIKYLDLLGKFSPLSQTINIKTDNSDAPGKLTKEDVAKKLAEILG
jgi:hypothetical protein